MIKEINKPSEILANSQSELFQIVLQLENGNVGFWTGNGFDYANDSVNFSVKAVNRNEVESEFGRALNVANTFAKQFNESGLLGVTNILPFN